MRLLQHFHAKGAANRAAARLVRRRIAAKACLFRRALKAKLERVISQGCTI
jgi:hypothetical protein